MRILYFTPMLIEDLYQLFTRSDGVSTDSRSILPGQLFFALSGENFNGNKFALSAIEKGAIAAIIDDSEYNISDNFILVDNCLATLQELARYHRKQFDIPFIGITGSNGKTTTKELIYEVLSQAFKVHATPGNFNNHIGVPLTLLSIPKETEIAIIEMGANHIGEIDALCQIALPTHGLITNISGAHLEGFGSFEGVKQAKSELYKFISTNGGILFYNKYDQVLKSLLLKEQSFKHGYSRQVSLKSFLKWTGTYPYLTLAYRSFQEKLTIESQLYGTYNAINIAAAIALGEFFGLSGNQLKAGVEGYIPKNNRSELIKWKNKTIILDAYNANPASMSASISHFANQIDGRKSLILGEMAELGRYSQEKHEELLQLIRKWNWEKVLLIGEPYVTINPSEFQCFRNTEELHSLLENSNMFANTDYFLLKGSRVSKLEILLPAIKSSSSP